MLLLTVYPPNRLVCQDPGPALDHASAVYDTVRTLSADFLQIVDNPMVGAPDTSRGHLFQERPNHFAMQFTKPSGDRLVADGRHFWIYTPSAAPDQVIRTAIPAAGGAGPNLISQFVDHPRERYTARYVRADSSKAGAVDVIHLAPKADDQPFTEATIWITRGTGLLARIEIVETSGQRRVVVLNKVRTNMTVRAGTFVFTPPSGVRVVDQ
jgi:outer membrane lipoprotein carrier protein